MTYIRDEVHGSIRINRMEKRIIDTWAFNRLHWVKQMGFANLVYPGANHTRFEHSLGTMKLADDIAHAINLSENEAHLSRLYALLHDIGHLPFSHEGERALRKWIGTHEEIGKDIITKGEVGDIISEIYSKRKIAKLFDKNSKCIEAKITNSDLGADRMDYLIRDNRNTGVAYGTIDVERIITQIGMNNKKTLYIKEGGIVAAESLLIGRHMMFCSVYLHHAVRIISAMLVRAIKRAVELDGIDPKIFIGRTDMEAVNILYACKHSKELIDRIMKRKLYKRIKVYKKMEEIPERVLKKVDDYNIILDRPSSFVKPVKILVSMNGRFIKLESISTLVSSLSKAEEDVKTIMIIGKRE